jgi:Tfp pilus assembly protein PilF
MSSRIQTLAKAIKEHPDDSFYKFSLALEMLKVGETNKAKVLFQNIVENDPQYVGVYYHLGKLYVELQQNEKALRTYTKGIEVAEQQNDEHSKMELQSAKLDLEMEMDY